MPPPYAESGSQGAGERKSQRRVQELRAVVAAELPLESIDRENLAGDETDLGADELHERRAHQAGGRLVRLRQKGRGIDGGDGARII